MKGSPCCAGLMRSCLHIYRTKTNLTQHIIQPWGRGGHQATNGGGHQSSMGGVISPLWGGPSANYGGAISQVWGGSSTNYGGAISQVWGGVINQLWGGHQPSMGGSYFPTSTTGSQNPQNYFSNTYVLPSVNRTAGPKRTKYQKWNVGFASVLMRWWRSFVNLTTL